MKKHELEFRMSQLTTAVRCSFRSIMWCWYHLCLCQTLLLLFLLLQPSHCNMISTHCGLSVVFLWVPFTTLLQNVTSVNVCWCVPSPLRSTCLSQYCMRFYSHIFQAAVSVYFLTQLFLIFPGMFFKCETSLRTVCWAPRLEKSTKRNTTVP